MKKDWEIKKLYEVCEIECGTRVVRKVDGGTIYPVYGGGGATFKMDTYNRENCLIVSRFAMSEKCTRFVEGKFFLNDSGLSLRANENVIYQKYLETVILGKNDEIYSLGRGAAQKNLDMARFRELEISYPKSLEEQKRIVKIMDEKFAQLETIKTNAQTNLQNAKDLLFAELTKTFSNEAWSKMTLQEVCTRKITDGTHQTPKYCTKEEGGFPFISSKDVTKEYIDWSNIKYIVPELHEELYKRIAPQKDDVLLAKNGTTGVAAIVEDDRVFDIYVTLAVLRPNQEIINPRYLLAIVNSPLCKKQFDAHLKGSGVPNLHLEEIQKIIIPVPPLDEQKDLISKIEALKEKIRTLQEIYTKQIANCDELKQAYLQKAFEGEL